MDEKYLLNRYHDFEVEIPLLMEDLAVSLSETNQYNNCVLNYELAIVEKIEKFYLDVISGKEKISSPTNIDRVIIAYLGEVLIHNAGGKWEMSLENDFTYGTPMIYEFKDDDGLGFSPFGILERVKKDKTKGVFKKSLEFCINKKQLESDLISEMKRLSKKKNR